MSPPPASNDPDVALCGLCGLRPTDPVVRACQRVTCPLKKKEAA